MIRLSILKNLTFWLSAIVAAACLVVAFKWPVGPLPWDVSLERLGATLGALLVVSFFVERVVEVFLSVWKRPEVDQKEQELEFWQAVQVDRRSDIELLEKRLCETAMQEADKTRIGDELKRKRDQAAEAETNADRLE